MDLADLLLMDLLALVDFTLLGVVHLLGLLESIDEVIFQLIQRFPHGLFSGLDFSCVLDLQLCELTLKLEILLVFDRELLLVQGLNFLQHLIVVALGVHESCLGLSLQILLFLLEVLEVLAQFVDLIVEQGLQFHYFCLVLLVALIVLDNYLILHVLKTLFQHLYVTDLFVHAVLLDQDNVGQLVIHHPHQRVQLVFSHLIMKASAHETLAVGKGNLVDEDAAVFGD